MGDVPFIVFSFLCVVFNLAPLCWQIEHGNSGAVCLGFWVIVLNLVTFVNAVVWRDDAINRAPIWCDISVKLQVAGPIGVLCGFLCIVRLLATVMSPRAPLQTPRDRRNRAIFDYSLCFGLPVLVMATHIVWQPNRFGIARTLGCAVTLVNSWPTYVLWLIWLPVLAAMGSVYAIYVIYRLVRYRRDFRRMLTASNSTGSALTVSRFVRLTALSCLYFCLELPLTIVSVVDFVNAAGRYIEYEWEFIHRYFSIITFSPLTERASANSWNGIIGGLLTIIFFGFAGEAASYYKKLFSVLGGQRLSVAAAERFSSSSDATQTKSAGSFRQLISFGRGSAETTPSFVVDMTSKQDRLEDKGNDEKAFYPGPFCDTLTREPSERSLSMAGKKVEERV